MKTDLIEDKISNFRWSTCLPTCLLLYIFEIIFLYIFYQNHHLKRYNIFEQNWVLFRQVTVSYKVYRQVKGGKYTSLSTYSTVFKNAKTHMPSFYQCLSLPGENSLDISYYMQYYYQMFHLIYILPKVTDVHTCMPYPFKGFLLTYVSQLPSRVDLQDNVICRGLFNNSVQAVTRHLSSLGTFGSTTNPKKCQ